MKITAPNVKQIPFKLVGSSTFGRYPKISNALTYNMIVSDGWFVPFAGHQAVATLAATGNGRGLYSSVRYNHLIAVINENVYTIDSNFGFAKIATIGTSFGDVFIAENNAKQIAISDLKNIYIFDYGANTFTRATIDFLPTAISFQDGRFISGDRRTNQWRLSDFNNGLSWPGDPSSVGVIQTKPDTVSYPLPIKGKGNALFLIGKTVTEQWYDLGYQLFPYQRNTFFNIDYGCLSAATVASQEDLVVWLAANEQSGPVIMVSQGGAPAPLSTDGINFKLAQLTTPQDSYGFIFKQDGHTFYQITFPTDNLTLLYDFNAKKFYHLCDKNMNYHIAKRVSFFNDAYYFISFNDGKLYEISSNYTTYNGDAIPRIRVTDPFRLPDTSSFITNEFDFVIEQGESQTVQRVDFSISKDGGQSFSNILTKNLNQTAHRRNRLRFWNLGRTNDLTMQFRFWSTGRFVCGDGTMSIYQ